MVMTNRMRKARAYTRKHGVYPKVKPCVMLDKRAKRIRAYNPLSVSYEGIGC